MLTFVLSAVDSFDRGAVGAGIGGMLFALALIAASVGWIALRNRWRRHGLRWRREAVSGVVREIVESADPLQTFQSIVRTKEGCAFVGFPPETVDDFSVAYRRDAVLVLGVPGQGKTSAIIVPSVLAAPGPVVSASTQTNVALATARVRSQVGRVRWFDPTGAQRCPDGLEELFWIPLDHAGTWRQARGTANVLVGASPAAHSGDKRGDFWQQRAEGLLAPLLYAARRGGLTMSHLLAWLRDHDLKSPRELLVEGLRRSTGDEAREVQHVINELDAFGNDRMNRQEVRSHFSTVSAVLQAYSLNAGTAANITRGNFDPNEFIRSRDTVYLAIPATWQEITGPIVAGFLHEIAQSVFARAAAVEGDASSRFPTIFWALDEAANIAPLEKLPNLVSEAGGQGLQIMACFQDLSQARGRWGAAADGFLSLFATKIILPGIVDGGTLEALSYGAGDWDRPYRSVTQEHGYSTGWGQGSGGSSNYSTSTQFTTQREPLLSPHQISTIPGGHALVMAGGRWSLIRLAPFHDTAQPLWNAIRNGSGRRV